MLTMSTYGPVSVGSQLFDVDGDRGILSMPSVFATSGGGRGCRSTAEVTKPQEVWYNTSCCFAAQAILQAES